jgi:hypothetical protein
MGQIGNKRTFPILFPKKCDIGQLKLKVFILELGTIFSLTFKLGLMKFG